MVSMARQGRVGRLWLPVATVAAVALQGCAQKPPLAPHTSLPVYQTDLLGAAKVCTVANPALQPGKTVDVAMAVTNDGGWCAITVHQAGPEPYAAGLLAGRPAHGKVLVHSVGDETRVDYTPVARFAGTDGFSVRLLPGDPVIRVAVTVARGAATAAPEPAKPEAKPPAKAKAKPKKK